MDEFSAGFITEAEKTGTSSVMDRGRKPTSLVKPKLKKRKQNSLEFELIFVFFNLEEELSPNRKLTLTNLKYHVPIEFHDVWHTVTTPSIFPTWITCVRPPPPLFVSILFFCYVSCGFCLFRSCAFRALMMSELTGKKDSQSGWTCAG
jgi:hypothetical protein